jgi:hypothetical protein
MLREYLSWAGTLLLAYVITNVPVQASAQDVATDPDRARLEVGDIHRLAQLLRSIGAGDVNDTSAVIDRDYLASASPGLRSYAENYNVTGASITSALIARPSHYADLDALGEAILAQEEELRSAFRRLAELFPDAVFPPIWFIVGDNGAAGLTRPEGVIIAAERFTERPEDIVPLVLHELAHFQQAFVQGVDAYQRIYGPKQTLLGLALREGSAELIAYLTTGEHINPAAERYGLANESELWCTFREEMYNRDPGDWLFQRPSRAEWPPDLGYWIGYRIAQSYYDRSENKAHAILDILGLTDFDAFLQASGYARDVEC